MSTIPHTNIDPSELSEWAQAKLAAEYDEYIKNTIKTSEMVEDGRLSEGNGRKVFAEVHDAYIKNCKNIQYIDKNWDEIWQKVTNLQSQ